MSGAAAGLRDRAGSLLLALGVTRPGRRGADDLHIATFHRVLHEAQRRDYPLPGLAVTPEELAWFLEFFARHFRCGTLRDTAERWAEGSSAPLLALTFDDGQLDNFELARPVLDRAQLRATFFAPVLPVLRNEPIWHDRLAFALRCALQSGSERMHGELAGLGVGDPRGADLESAVHAGVARAKLLDAVELCGRLERLEAALPGPTRPAWDGMMSFEQLRILAGEGHEIGSHSMSHPLLPTCDDEQLEEEVGRSRRELEDRVGVSVDSFCYPDGAYDERTVDAVRSSGYRWGVTTRWGASAAGTSPFELRRCDMDARHTRDRAGRMSAPRLAWRLSGLYPGLGRGG